MVKIFVDYRDLRSPVAKELDKLGADMTFVNLEVGDYVLSDRVCVERKTTEDFLSSWLQDRKLFSQVMNISFAYERPLLIVEGVPEELFTSRMVNPKAVWGVLRTIAISFRCPVFYMLNAAETAEQLFAIAKKEQEDDPKPFNPHPKRSGFSAKEQKEYVVSSFPNCDIGIKKARDLLNHFKTIENIIKADVGELQEVHGIGEGTATQLRKILTERY